MGWISAAGTGLRVAGEILESAEFQDWVASKGKEYLEKKLAAAGVSLFRDKTVKAQKEILSDLNAMIKSDALRLAIRDYEEKYRDFLSKICKSLNNNAYVGSNITYLIPRFSINRLAELDLRDRLWNAAVVRDLFPDDTLKDLFFRALLHDMDESLSKLEVSPTKPIKLGDIWSIISKDLAANWRNEFFNGHYFLFHGEVASGFGFSSQGIEKQVKETNRKFVELTGGQRDEIISAWQQACSDIHTGKPVTNSNLLKYLSSNIY